MHSTIRTYTCISWSKKKRVQEHTHTKLQLQCYDCCTVLCICTSNGCDFYCMHYCGTLQSSSLSIRLENLHCKKINSFKAQSWPIRIPPWLFTTNLYFRWLPWSYEKFNFDISITCSCFSGLPAVCILCRAVCIEWRDMFKQSKSLPCDHSGFSYNCKNL